MKENKITEDMNPNEAAQVVVESWFDNGAEEIKADVTGSYTGMTSDCESPEQDADDL